MLEISQLVKRYGHDDPVLKGLDLRVEGNSVVSIVGASGAGKSTLLRCINRLIEPTSGSIRLNGQELSSLKGAPLRQARRRIGMVFQGFNLIDRLTVMEKCWPVGLATSASFRHGGGASRRRISNAPST